jgi:uncharacterized protein YndB with AHSA1/START domain
MATTQAMKQDKTFEAMGELTAPDTIRFERLLPASQETVWSFLEDSEKRGQWLGSGPMDPRVGGRIEIQFHNDSLSDEKAPPEHAAHGGCFQDNFIITEIDPPSRLGFTWQMKDRATQVLIELTPAGDGTLMVLTHKNLAATTMQSVGPGWHTHIGLLIDRLNHRKVRGFWSAVDSVKDDYKTLIAAISG